MKFYNIFVLLALCIIYSCVDNLDLYPVSDLTDENFWTNEKDLQVYANSFYTILPGNSGASADNQTDCYVPYTPNTWLFNQEVVPTSGGGWSSGDWGNIRSCNYFLQRYSQVQGNEDNINCIVGEVKFFRAWEYFYKLRRFGEVPWYSTDLQTNSEELYNARDSRELVVDSILKDLDFAIAHLPVPGKTETGRLHKYAAMAFKVRVCLYEATFRKYHNGGIHGNFTAAGYTGLFNEAISTAESLMETGQYSVYSTGNPEKDYYDLFVQDDLTSNSECIMPRIYVTDVLTHNNTRQLEESYTGLSKAFVETYLCTDGQPIGISSLYQGDNMPEYELAGRDPRLAQTIDNPGLAYKIEDDGTIQYRELPRIDPQYCTTGYYVMKGHSPYVADWNASQSAIDAFIFRYAEVLLAYAEAKAELDECTQEVLDVSINKLRDRVGVSHLTATVGFTDPNAINYSYSLSPLLHEIRRERAVELAGEGFRWDDIVRWAAGTLIEANKTMLGLHVSETLQAKYSSFSQTLNSDRLLVVYSSVTSRKWHDKLYLRPVPIEQLSLNSNLKQTPGWE